MKKGEFEFSLYKDDLIRFVKDGKEQYAYYKYINANNSQITYTEHDTSKETKCTTIRTLDKFQKMNVDLLGNIYSSDKEEREWN